jgi:hypothetical protein
MDHSEPIEMAPIRIRITHEPPSVVLVSDGVEVDLRPSLELLQLEIHPVGCFVTLTLRAEVDLDFPVRTVFVAREAEIPDAHEIDAWVSTMGWDQTLGQVVREHLQKRASGGA